MARLPKPGGDEGIWGDVLNEFLLQGHNSDGSLKLEDATQLTAGVIKLAGDLTGSAAAPTVRGLSGKVNTDDARLTDERTPRDGSVTDAKVADDANIAQGKIAGLPAALAAKVDASDPRLSDERTPADGSVTDAKVAAGAGIAQGKIAGLPAALAGKYAKPASGIPMTDLTLSLQAQITEPAGYVKGESIAKITVGALPPASPQLGDVWIVA